MRKIILSLALFLIVLPLTFAFSTDPQDYVFYDVGDQGRNGTFAWTPADGDLLTSYGYGYSGTSCEYDSDGIKVGNMTIMCDGTSSLHLVSVDIAPAGINDVTILVSLYDDGNNGEAMLTMQDTAAASLQIFGVKTATSATNYIASDVPSPVTRMTNAWVNFTMYMAPANAYFVMWVNGTNTSNDTTVGDFRKINQMYAQAGKNARWEIIIWNGTPDERPTGGGGGADVTPPEIKFYNMTSEGGEGCTNWNTDKSNPCVTNDTTPTVFVNTSENTYCAIGVSDYNYTNLTGQGINRSCYGGLAKEHTCDLKWQDELTQEDSQIYIGCQDGDGNENLTSTSGALALKIHAKETGGAQSILTGIQNALSAPYTTYPSQQISARDLNNNQFTGTFDWVAKKSSKVWAFNYISSGESHVANTFNLTPVLYVLQLTNTTQSQVTSLVETMITATK